MSKEPGKDPLHGVTLEQIVKSLVEFYGWDGLGHCIEIDCFNRNPSLKSSLKFLRKTPWARKKVENLFLGMKMDQRAEEERITTG
ncbi:MAG: VF530 family protein [Desulfuromonadales bacterium]|nr:VF530 family protein [Desulfuromonadales bacterium]